MASAIWTFNQDTFGFVGTRQRGLVSISDKGVEMTVKAAKASWSKFCTELDEPAGEVTLS